MSPNEKVEKLEEMVYENKITVSRIEGEIKGRLESIEALLINLSDLKDGVIVSREKHKVSEARLVNIEKLLKEHEDRITGINLKIATVSGAWAVVLYIISKI